MSNNTISLSKNQTISLKKQDGSGLKKIFMGLAWREASQTGGFLKRLFSSAQPIDLDSSVLCFDKNGNYMKDNTVWFRQTETFNDAIKHSGDNREGGNGKDDDERINIDLERLPANVQTLVFTVNSFTGQSFETVESARCRLVDAETNTEKASIDLTATGPHQGVIMAKIYRVGNGWEIKSIAEIGKGASRTFDDLLPQIRKHI